VFAVVGAPLYRYQAALHPFMLATVVIGLGAACTTAIEFASRRGSRIPG
jgi:hypothetical protein